MEEKHKKRSLNGFGVIDTMQIKITIYNRIFILTKKKKNRTNAIYAKVGILKDWLIHIERFSMIMIFYHF